MIVDFTETLAAVQSRPVLNVEPPLPPRAKRRTPRSLRVKAAFQAAEVASADVSTNVPRQPVEESANEENGPLIANAPSSQTTRLPQINAETPVEENACDALTTYATTVEPDRSFYFSESTETARSADAPRPSTSAPTSTFSDAPNQTQSRKAPRLTILQRFVKLVAQNQTPAVAPPREPQIPNRFGENVAFVVSPFASPEPPTQPIDASFPFVVDAFEPAPQDYFSYF